MKKERYFIPKLEENKIFKILKSRDLENLDNIRQTEGLLLKKEDMFLGFLGKKQQ